MEENPLPSPFKNNVEDEIVVNWPNSLSQNKNERQEYNGMEDYFKEG